MLLLSTVALEAEWVLRSGYDLDRPQVFAALKAFAGLEIVTAQEPDRLAKAIEWAEGGLDFADALHPADAEGCDGFVSLEKRLVAAASRLDAPPVKAL